MRIDLPCCSFKDCRKCFDGNCLGTKAYREGCEYLLMRKSIEEVSEMYPYKVVGETDTYCQYNEAWQDCINMIKAQALME